MSSAIISPCGTYRYVLRRDLSGFLGSCLFVMLNPSTADANIDDPTIRRCVGFANSWRCSKLTVVNLFGLRSPDPEVLARHPDPFGPENTKHIVDQVLAHDVIVAAWGAHPMASSARFLSHSALKTVLRNGGARCLGMTKDGSPRHPLYVRADQPLVLWTGT